MIFESNAYLPPNFLLNADFKIESGIFTPYIFSQCCKEKVVLFWSRYLQFCVVLNIAYVVIYYCLWYYIYYKHLVFIPPATKLGGGILESPCPSVCPSVDARTVR